ncbi:hypothetical protein [Pseudoalteromonas sp. MEBiC 03485]|uniref:hypothetical protein n=1 Tax=Pseudoalteromonas sp. MEBiC 03485 TaxID=2571103 RepID=UPI001F0D4C54|nr:hypothetical protein [Pseudoalteromonas sp. MEBiC 03485]
MLGRLIGGNEIVYSLLRANIIYFKIISDEIADVTRIGKAPPNWGELCRKVRKYGGRLCAITQRPQESDKTILNQVEFTWCGALKTSASYNYMAKEMDLSVQELKSIVNIDRKQIQYWLRKGLNKRN